MCGPDSIVSVLMECLPTVQWPPHLPQFFCNRLSHTLKDSPCSLLLPEETQLHNSFIPEGVEMLPSNTVEDRREEPRPGGPCGHLAPPWLLSHPTHHAGLELLLRPHLTCLFFLPSFLLFLSSPLNHLPSIDNSANCWCFTKYMLRRSFKENPHSCKQ